MIIHKKKALTLFALTLLIASMLLIYMNGPTSAQTSTDFIYLDGPPLEPIHMNSNKTLTPVHMHYTGGDYVPFPPIETVWHQLYPDLCENWILTSFEDVGLPYGELSPNDQIDMTNMDTYEVRWYHVDRMTWTMRLYTEDFGFPEEIYVEYKGPYEKIYDPICTWWHEVQPLYSNVYHIINWTDNGSQDLDFCDFIEFEQFPDIWWHVEEISTDIILREKLVDPICTWWHAIYPEEEYCKWYHVTSWEPMSPPHFYPGDQIDMTDEEGNVTWYFVDRITVTLNVSLETDKSRWMKIELKSPFDEIYEVFKHPNGSLWHEVYPEYCNVYNLTRWHWWEDDNCNGVLDVCDFIYLQNVTSQEPETRWHIDDMTYDLILNRKIADPTCTTWHEIDPDLCEIAHEYHITGWEDNGDELLSPCDNVTMELDPPSPDTDKYHVENMTLTLNLTVIDPIGGPVTQGQRIFLELLYVPYEYMYWPKIEPWYYEWAIVCPGQFSGLSVWIEHWDDNCNGVLSYCDNITLVDPVGSPFALCHVDEVAVDMVVEKVEGPPPPPPPPQLYWKENYPEYAPSGVPDFDQRQDNWNISSPFGGPWWTWCAPTAVSNSLWWMDSKFDPSNLLTKYPAAIGEHDPSNVQPFIEHLAWLMDTDAQRTGIFHRGTWTWDMETGIAQYLSWSGVNPLGDVNGDGIVDQTDWNIVNTALGSSVVGGVPVGPWNMEADISPETVTGPYTADNKVNQSDLDLVTAHMGETGQFYEHTVPTPDFYLVAEEVYRCEDVVLVLGFWTYNPIDGWVRVGYPDTPYEEIGLGHAVTVAGINSTSVPPLIAISDPANDAFEAGLTPGRSPVNHTHMLPEPPYTMHNNASLVSHDIYNVTFIAGCPGGTWALQGYVGNPQAGAPPGTIAVVESAVITSPLEVEVCGVNITNVVTSHCGHTVNAAYKTWGVNVTVTVHNNGTVPVNCTVSAYYFNVTGAYQIGTSQNVTNLDPCNTTTRIFIWDLAGLPVNVTYTVKANATCTGGASDEFVDGAVKKRVWGDVDGIDDAVTSFDLKKVTLAIPGYVVTPYADVDGDCDTTSFDLKKVKLLIPGYLDPWEP
jgi:hypothetical protein